MEVHNNGLKTPFSSGGHQQIIQSLDTARVTHLHNSAHVFSLHESNHYDPGLLNPHMTDSTLLQVLLFGK